MEAIQSKHNTQDKCRIQDSHGSTGMVHALQGRSIVARVLERKLRLDLERAKEA